MYVPYSPANEKNGKCPKFSYKPMSLFAGGGGGG